VHELSLCQAVIDTVEAHASGRRASQVNLRIGHLRQVVPDSLQFSWELLTDGTPLAGCKLDIKHVPGVITCRSCEEQTELDWPVFVCGTCGADDVKVLTGEEFLIVAIDLEEASS